MDHSLTPSQIAAIEHVKNLSSGSQLDRHLEVTLNFHPDRFGTDGRLLLDALAEDGVYYSQFVTNTSNGGLSAFPGGNRWQWESRIFGGSYDTAPAQERPVYGALNFRRKAVGAAPRFGSAYFRLHPHVLSRSTFCYPDSYFEPTDFGVEISCGLIPIALADSKDNLDDYIEAQVHGEIKLSRDMAALVLDPCFQGTEVEQAARKLPCPLEWHGGFRLSVEELKKYPEYRGEEIVELGCLIAEDNLITPFIIGKAVNSRKFDNQAVKKVWHYLARYGDISTVQN